ncbi:hypothetical protein [Vulgatibacter sp.]|uniref:hypothetical protein n=1 Tax=Vulgatibacter sp. TaxID=1971226 RepID=UPI003566E89A
MRRFAPLLLLALAACPRPTPQAPELVDCALAGRPELGKIEPLDCAAVLDRRFPAPAAAAAGSDRPANFDPLLELARTELVEITQGAADRCERRNRCELDDASFRAALADLEAQAAERRGLVEAIGAGGPAREGARRRLARVLGAAWMQPERMVPSCPADLPQACPDGTCAPEAASCCGDGTHCAGGVCCGTGCCGEGEICNADGVCEASPACGGSYPQACPDGSCAPAGADCCGEGRFCRTGTCCGDGNCCTAFEACVAGRCVPGAQAACSDPGRPIPCPDGACAPIGGSCCGGGRICESGTCCGESACCVSGEVCEEGRCVGPSRANPDCGGAWPVTCADGSCAPAGAACCGEGRFCAPRSSCCGDGCCLQGEICVEGACVGA